MTIRPPLIETGRLLLVSLLPDELEALIACDVEGASALAGVRFPPGWPEDPPAKEGLPWHLERLLALPAKLLEKTCLSIPPFGIDVFAPPLDGVSLVRGRVRLVQCDGRLCGAFLDAADVTRDPRFRGGRFVTMSSDELSTLLRAFGIRRSP